MKRLSLIILVLSISSLCSAESDSLIIHFKSGEKRTIALSEIRKITFDSLKSGVKTHQKEAVSFVYPNPSTSGANIGFTLAEPGHVEVAIFNGAEGKLIRTIKPQYLIAGPNQIFWDGLDDRGLRILAGTYLCEVRSKGKLQVSKMIVLNK